MIRPDNRSTTVGDGPVRVAALRLSAALAAVLLLGSACGEEAPEGPLGSDGKVSSSSSASPSASASPTAQPPAVPAAAKDSAAGREAFARWFAQAFGYAFATNDPTPINDVASTEKGVECGTCQLFSDYLEQRKKDDVVVKPSSYEVEQVFASGKDKGAWIYTLITARPAYANVKSDGTVVDEHPKDGAYLIEVGLRWNGGGYELTGWTAGKKKDR
jgi:hypothetical protein